ncbi:MAG: hypothetical protein CSB48_11880 [Proteobacteria bacterium]|nr:MAG: hypothetical protein CSB48_11880 [Pseudomonadota bacterium]
MPCAGGAGQFCLLLFRLGIYIKAMGNDGCKLCKKFVYWQGKWLFVQVKIQATIIVGVQAVLF